ncbi:MAG: hypothetical protein ACRC1H_02390, partial [Caldilineaceae bacterium]
MGILIDRDSPSPVYDSASWEPRQHGGAQIPASHGADLERASPGSAAQSVFDRDFFGLPTQVLSLGGCAEADGIGGAQAQGGPVALALGGNAEAERAGGAATQGISVLALGGVAEASAGGGAHVGGRREISRFTRLISSRHASQR